ncbi:MAG: hypothetical protein ABIJ34_09035 [archaeon]
MGKGTYATLINLAGEIIFILLLSPFRLYAAVFPLIFFTITWVYFRKEFWEAYVGSIVTLILAVFGFVFIAALTPYREDIFRVIVVYIYSLV